MQALSYGFFQPHWGWVSVARTFTSGERRTTTPKQGVYAYLAEFVRINVNIIGFQKLPDLLLKGHFPVMLFLI